MDTKRSPFFEVETIGLSALVGWNWAICMYYTRTHKDIPHKLVQNTRYESREKVVVTLIRENVFVYECEFTVTLFVSKRHPTVEQFVLCVPEITHCFALFRRLKSIHSEKFCFNLPREVWQSASFLKEPTTVKTSLV